MGFLHICDSIGDHAIEKKEQLGITFTHISWQRFGKTFGCLAIFYKLKRMLQN